MCKAFDDMRAEGRMEGEDHKERELLTKMYHNGMSVSLIASMTDLTIAHVQQVLLKEVTPAAIH